MMVWQFRGVAFIVSACHFTEYWSKSYSKFSSLLDLVVFFDFVGRLFTAIIVFAFGVNQHFWRESQRRKGRSDGQLFLVSVKRGVAFFALGVLFNALCWEFPANIFDMDILIFYAFAAVILPIFWRMKRWKIVVAAVLVILLQSYIRRNVNVASAWVESVGSGEKEAHEARLAKYNSIRKMEKTKEKRKKEKRKNCF